MKEVITLEKINEILYPCQFTQLCSGTKSVFIDNIGISLNVNNDESKTFEFSYMIKRTIFYVESGSMSPVTNEQHLRKMYEKFRNTIIKYFGVGGEENEIYSSSI